MSSNKTEQEHVPMANAGNSDRPETGNLLMTTTTTTTAVVETRDNYEIVIVQGDRDNWSNRVVYLLSIIGFVVDLGNFFFVKEFFFLKIFIFQ